MYGGNSTCMNYVFMVCVFLLPQIKDTISVQTRIKLGEEITAQIVPVQAQAPRPPFLQNIRLGLEEEKKQTQQQQGSQSFLQKYVSNDLFIPFQTYLF